MVDLLLASGHEVSCVAASLYSGTEVFGPQSTQNTQKFYADTATSTDTHKHAPRRWNKPLVLCLVGKYIMCMLASRLTVISTDRCIITISHLFFILPVFLRVVFFKGTAETSSSMCTQAAVFVAKNTSEQPNTSGVFLSLNFHAIRRWVWNKLCLRSVRCWYAGENWVFNVLETNEGRVSGQRAVTGFDHLVRLPA